MTARKNPPAPPRAAAADNLSNLLDGGNGAPVDELPSEEDNPSHIDIKTSTFQGSNPLPASAKRVWIQLEDNDDIPPTGQFIGVNGRSYILRPGEPAKVPEEVIEVLQDAVMSVPIQDANFNVVGYRDRLRFPFRFVREPKQPVAA